MAAQKKFAGKTRRNGIPLTGIHLNVDCEACHQSSDEKQFTLVSAECIQCHQTIFENTSNPDHLKAKFSKNCENCHSMGFISWKAPAFVHPPSFVIRGAHQSLECNDCHANKFEGLGTECVNCHKSNYDNSRNPDHKMGNFPFECDNCHSENGWRPAEFDHSLTKFPLTGAHQSLPCESCHQNGNYTNLQSDCYSCHQADYEQVNDPNHAAAHFSTLCEECHNTSNWNQVSWDHDSQYFPIYSGPHKEPWKTCNDCHVNPNDFTVFECINCHEHDQIKMDDKHKNVRDDTYQSDACYACHPNGRKE